MGVLAAAALVAAIVYAVSHEDNLELLAGIDYRWLPVLLASTLLGLLAQGYCTKVVTRLTGPALRFQEWFGLKIIHLACNYVIPFSGLGFRGFYLKKLYGVAAPAYLASIGMKTLIQLAVYSVCGSLALVYWMCSRPARPGMLEWTALGGMAVVAACSLAVSLVPNLLKSIPRLSKIHDKMAGSGSFSRQAYMALLTANILEYLTFVLTFFVTASALGVATPLNFAFVSTAISSYSLLIRITPASLGFYEASITFSSQLYGIGLTQSLLIAGTMRIMTILAYLVLMPWFGHHLAKRANVRLTDVFQD